MFLLSSRLNTECPSIEAKITFMGFGSFEARHRSAREGRNPKTGEPMTISAVTVPAFSAGKLFKERVSGNGSEDSDDDDED